MKKLFLIPVIFLFVIGHIAIFGEPNDASPEYENADTTEPGLSAPKIFFLPMASYSFVAFEGVRFHNPLAGVTMIRFNPADFDKLFSLSLMYSPQIVTGMSSDYPGLYHNAVLSIAQKLGRHLISGAFIANTDKPVYGGLRTFMGMAGYSYNLIQGPHFSMNLGAYLMLMDIDITLDNGTPWLLWPIPSISLAWEYDWITLGLVPDARLVLGPREPLSLMLTAGMDKFDTSLWYRRFKNGDTSAERLGIGFGLKRDTNDITQAEGLRYGISYYAVYGALRLFRFFEVSGGWAFDGKEGSKKIDKDTLFGSAGFSMDSMYNKNIGDGFFVSVSARLGL
jgi:hypothetical protein